MAGEKRKRSITLPDMPCLSDPCVRRMRECRDGIARCTSGLLVPKSVRVHGRSVDVYGDAAVAITDCDYALSIGSFSKSHHLAVNEAYVREAGEWGLV